MGSVEDMEALTLKMEQAEALQKIKPSKKAFKPRSKRATPPCREEYNTRKAEEETMRKALAKGKQQNQNYEQETVEKTERQLQEKEKDFKAMKDERDHQLGANIRSAFDKMNQDFEARKIAEESTGIVRKVSNWWQGKKQ